MLHQKDGQTRYLADRCCQCGVCLASCPSDALAKCKTSKQYLIQVDTDKCCGCGLCVRVCPAHVVDKASIPPDALSKAKDLFLSYARDSTIRRFASSGGVTRTLLQNSLKKGVVDAVYTLMYPDAALDQSGNMSDIDREAEGTWADSIPELFRIPCSLYRPVLWGENLRANVPKSGKVLLVGLPCQLKAAKRLLELIRPKLKIVSIAIFCRKNKNFGYSGYFRRLAGLRPHKDEHKVVYRGGGWPGAIRVLSEKEKPMAYFYPALCWNLSACNYCLDCTNMAESDLTVTDPWGIVKQESETCGQNLVLVWTEEGRQLMRECGDALATTPVSIDQAAIPFDYPSIQHKEMKAMRLQKSSFFHFPDMKSVLIAKVGEAFYHFIPQQSGLMGMIRQILSVFRGSHSRKTN